MADYVEKSHSADPKIYLLAVPPRELKFWFDYQNFGTLPEAGGLLDQPAGLMDRIRWAVNVYESMSDWLEARNRVVWTQKNPKSWRVVQQVFELRKADTAEKVRNG